MERLLGQLLAHRLGDAEVDDLGHRPDVMHFDQHVTGLEIAVDHALLMRVLHAVAERDEQLQPLARRELLLIAVLRDRGPLDQLHREVRSSRVGRTGIEHLGDVRMIHQGQGLPFGLEPRHHFARVHAGLDDLQGHFAADGFSLRGHVHDAHAAFADLLQQLVGADLGAGVFGESGRRCRSRQCRSSDVEESPASLCFAES